jgi:hypothetical protein
MRATYDPMRKQEAIDETQNPDFVTTVDVADRGTFIGTNDSTLIPVQITPIDSQNLDLTPQPAPPQDQQKQQ